MATLRGIVEAYNSTTHIADVLAIDAPHALYVNVPVATNIMPATIGVGHLCILDVYPDGRAIVLANYSSGTPWRLQSDSQIHAGGNTYTVGRVWTTLCTITINFTSPVWALMSFHICYQASHVRNRFVAFRLDGNGVIYQTIYNGNLSTGMDLQAVLYCRSSSYWPAGNRTLLVQYYIYTIGHIITNNGWNAVLIGNPNPN